MRDAIVRFLDLVTHYDGIGARTDHERYLELIAAGESPEVAEAMSRESGCALVVRGFWRLFGIADRRLAAPYVPGKAIAWLVALARERGAWVEARPDALPGIGDTVLVGGDPAADGGVEHVFTVLELQPDPLTIRTLDGGQVDEDKGQIICRKERTWAVRGSSVWDVVSSGTDPGAASSPRGGGRRVKGWVAFDALAGDAAS
jgi:hypothetical protein